MQTARVVLDRATHAYDKEYDYLLPEGMKVSPGSRVLAPFGAGNRARAALVMSVSETEETGRLKAVQSVLDEEPLLNEEGLYLMRVLTSTTFCTWGDALHCLIPPGAGVRVQEGLSPVRGLDASALSADAARLYEQLLKQKRTVSAEKALAAVGLKPGAAAEAELIKKGFAARCELVSRRVADERAVYVRLIECEGAPKMTKKQQAAAEFLTQVGFATVREILYYTGVTRSVIDRMQKAGLVELYEEISPRAIPEGEKSETAPAPIELSDKQQEAFDALAAESLCGEGAVSLLYGVTGSGKTQVYLKLIEDTLKRGRRALVLIPEISLTPQTAAIFSARFGEKVAVLHSSLSVTQRLDQWRRIRAGKADIVVGTRSAVFAPLENIGLIVIDEEQEHTYHSERAPRFHAREIAKIRAKYHSAHLLLCSATPSVESMAAAKRGSYKLVKLGERFSSFGLPSVDVIDLRTSPMAPGSTLISQELGEQISETLNSGEQAILFLNRRGYHTLTKCSSCGEVARCTNCSVPLSYHSANDRLVCHYCGHSRPAKSPCERCKSELMRSTGAGTQRAEEELSMLYPEARILRLDADTTMSRFSHKDKFEAFARGEYDIMVGTQMIAKGLDFEKVTLVGVLSADQSLYTEDFRAFERTFSLVTQVVGRSGRADRPGRAVIQTYSPEHRVLELASRQDYDSFFEEEMDYRRVGLYPPYCDMMCFVFAAEDERAAQSGAQSFAKAFAETAKNHPEEPIRLLGPAPCSPYRAAGRYRCRLIVKCRNSRRFRALVREALAVYTTENKDAVYPSIDGYSDANG